MPRRCGRLLEPLAFSGGDPYYPEFCARPEFFIRESPGLLNSPIIRGWDFGWHCPTGAKCLQKSAHRSTGL